MEHQRIVNLLNEASDSKFVTRKWNIVNDQSNINYDEGNEFIYNAEVLKSNLCDNNDSDILLRVSIAITRNVATRVVFKNCAPLIKCITKIDRTILEDAEDLDLVVPIYTLLEYSSNYFNTTGSLWFYWKDEADDFDNAMANTNAFKSFKYKTKLIGSTATANGILKNAYCTIKIPLKQFLEIYWYAIV